MIEKFSNLLFAALLDVAGARYMRMEFDEDDRQKAVMDLSRLDRERLRRDLEDLIKSVDEIPEGADGESWERGLDDSFLGELDSKYRRLKISGHREKRRRAAAENRR